VAFVPLALAGLLTTACGSSLNLDTQKALDAAARGEGGDGSFTSADGTVGSTGAQGVAAVGGTGSSTTVSGGGGSVAGGGTTGSGSTSAAGASGAGPAGTTGAGPKARSAGLGPGVTDTTIKVGAIIATNVNEAQAAFGGSYVFPDEKKQHQPLIDYINAHGGIAGRKVLIDYYTVDATSNQDFATFAQAVCTHFTQDVKVFAVIWAGDDTAPCLADAGVPLLISSPSSAAYYGTKTYDALGGYYLSINNIAFPRYMRGMAEGLVRMGWFPKGAKVGIAYMGIPTEVNGIENFLKPTLRRLGVNIVDTEKFPELQRQSDYSQTVAQAQGAALRFKSEGITHVIVPDTQGTTFMDAAQNNDYHPLYATTSYIGPVTTAPYVPEQLPGAVGFGFVPLLDVLPVDQGGPVSPAEPLCRKLMQQGGGDTGDVSWQIMRFHCDGYFILRDALAGVKTPNAAALTAGIEALGTRFQSSVVPGTRFAPGHYDGAMTIRPFKFIESCTCFRYSGPAVDVR
jgi:hypothetical protein